MRHEGDDAAGGPSELSADDALEGGFLNWSDRPVEDPSEHLTGEVKHYSSSAQLAPHAPQLHKLDKVKNVHKMHTSARTNRAPLKVYTKWPPLAHMCTHFWTSDCIVKHAHRMR